LNCLLCVAIVLCIIIVSDKVIKLKKTKRGIVERQKKKIGVTWNSMAGEQNEGKREMQRQRKHNEGTTSCFVAYFLFYVAFIT
jgi:hypothetical protein